MAKKTGLISPTAQQAAKNVQRLYNQNKNDPRYMKNLTGQGTGKTTETVNQPQAKVAQAFKLADFLKKRGM